MSRLIFVRHTVVYFSFIIYTSKRFSNLMTLGNTKAVPLIKMLFTTIFILIKIKIPAALLMMRARKMRNIQKRFLIQIFYKLNSKA